MGTLKLALVACTAAFAYAAFVMTPASAHSLEACIQDVFSFCGDDTGCKEAGLGKCVGHVHPGRTPPPPPDPVLSAAPGGPLILGLAFSLGLRGSAAAESALEMREWCEPAITGGLSPTDTAAVILAGRCIGSFDTLSGVIVTEGLGTKEPYRTSCLPNEATLNQLVRVFMHYTDTHPEELHRSWIVVALDALVEAFPCRKGG